MEEEKLAVEKTLALERQQHAKELELAQAEIQGLAQKQQQDKGSGNMTTEAKKLAKKMEKQVSFSTSLPPFPFSPRCRPFLSLFFIILKSHPINTILF